MQESKKIAKLNFTEIDPHVESLLKSIVVGKQVLQLQKKTPVFSQGDPADDIYFIRSGSVKVTVVSAQGREAILAMLGPRDFFGEGCLVGQSLRISTATTTESSALFRVQKRAMLQALNAEPRLSEKFVASLIVRNLDMEEDICNQLFNHSENLLARVLLKLSRFGQHDFLPDAKLSQLSHETLADLVGTTPSRILHLLSKFRRLGLIHGNGEIMVRTEMLADMVLRVGDARPR